MRKTILALILVLATASVSFADWSVTVTWDRSTDPNLDYEQCQLDGDVKAVIQETETTTCNFSVENLTNQEVKIVSFNKQGASSDYIAGKLFSVPQPASGGHITTTWVNP